MLVSTSLGLPTVNGKLQACWIWCSFLHHEAQLLISGLFNSASNIQTSIFYIEQATCAVHLLWALPFASAGLAFVSTAFMWRTTSYPFSSFELLTI
jgi:hypothetical protein